TPTFDRDNSTFASVSADPATSSRRAAIEPFAAALPTPEIPAGAILQEPAAQPPHGVADPGDPVSARNSEHPAIWRISPIQRMILQPVRRSAGQTCRPAFGIRRYLCRSGKPASSGRGL